MPNSSNNDAGRNYEGWIDLFMWGTSNWNNTDDPYSVHFQPWSQRDNGTYDDENNEYGIGPSLENPYHGPDLDGTNYDWGVYNKILNPLTNTYYPAETWRTPTESEIDYLLNNRPKASSLRGYGIIHDVNGLIILPDNCPIPAGLVFSPDRTDENEYNDVEWSLMEGCGAVFFPCAGKYRDLSDGIGENEDGFYWTATHYGQSSGSSKDEWSRSAKAYNWGFSMNEEPFVDDDYRYQHCSVRLVKDVTSSK